MATLLPLFRNAIRTGLPESDVELLDRFAAGRDEDAFVELVRRHGPVVYRVCRRLVGSSAADDAFQASFLVLATRLDAARAAGSIGGWLIGVAGRVARQMRRGARRRARYETAARHDRCDGSDDSTVELKDQARILEEELTRLPDQLRDPVVLCWLQGRTQEQAAAVLGRDARTLRRRLDRAKQLLRARLERRGVIPVVAAALVSGAGSATAALPNDLSLRTVALVFDFLTGGRAMARFAPVVLANGVATTMMVRKVMSLMAAAAIALVGLGVVVAGDDPRSGKLKGEDSRNETAIVQSAPKAGAGERQVMIQATCVQVPAGFCKDCGLAEEDGSSAGVWALTPREARMLTALFRGAQNEKREIEFLSRPQIQVIENQTGFVQIGQNVPYTTVEAEKKDGKIVYNHKISYQLSGASLKVTPRINADGKVLMRVEPTLSTVSPMPVDLGNGIKSPVFNIQTVQVTALVAAGETAVVSGGKHKRDKENYEVLWLLTPHIVRPDEKIRIGDPKITPLPAPPFSTTPPTIPSMLLVPTPATAPGTGVTPVVAPPALPPARP